MRKPRREKEVDAFEERVVSINRVTKVVKGGRRIRFSALVIVGDKAGQVGFGLGKAQEVPDAIKKAIQNARKDMKQISLVNGTIPHEITGRFGAGKVFLKPASEGTGVIAGGAVRVICELAGINDILSKTIGSKTPVNVVRATFAGLEALRTIEDVAKLRGISVEEMA